MRQVTGNNPLPRDQEHCGHLCLQMRLAFTTRLSNYCSALFILSPVWFGVPAAISCTTGPSYRAALRALHKSKLNYCLYPSLITEICGHSQNPHLVQDEAFVPSGSCQRLAVHVAA